MKLNIRSISGIAAMLVGAALSANASTVTYDFGQISGGTPPAGPSPWLQAVFTDTGLPANTVQLTISAGNLIGNEFVSCWYFNLNPALDPTGLNFSVAGSTGSFTDPTVQKGINGFKAGPDGKYDILLGFSTSGGNSTRFTSGDSLTFTITGILGLTANDFDQLSEPAGGSGPYTSAAHVQDPPDGSGWVNPTSTTLLGNADTAPRVPDGSATIVLLGASLIAIGSFGRAVRKAA